MPRALYLYFMYLVQKLGIVLDVSVLDVLVVVQGSYTWASIKFHAISMLFQAILKKSKTMLTLL